MAGLIILASVSIADAQRGGGGGRGGSGGGRSFGGGGRSFGGGGGRSIGGGGARFNAVPPRGNFGAGNRIAAGPRFAPGRSYGGIRGGIGLNYRGNYGRPYAYGGGFYGGGYGAYYRGYFPRIGFYINTLPYGYYPFSYGGYPYYYNEGLFYQQYNDGYQVVAPPVGAEVPRLPRGAQDITIDGKQYFEKDGIYYLPIINEDGKKVYQVAGKDGVLNTDGNQDEQQHYNEPADQQNGQYPPQYSNALPRVGDVVNSIPADSRKVKINGEKLFVSPDGVYYQEDDSSNTRIFKVVGVPSEDGGTDAIAPN
ncbi:MAG: DUF6515 family protein [Janthinobacterium lividum]